LEPSVSCGDDFGGIGFPGEWLGIVGIVFADKSIDDFLKIDDGMEDAVLEPTPREFGEEALDGIEPGARRRSEVEDPARVATSNSRCSMPITTSAASCRSMSTTPPRDARWR